MQDRLIIFLAHIIIKPFYWLIWRPKPINKLRLPRGGAILVGNHISYHDPLTIGIYCPRFPHFMAKRELFRFPVSLLLNWLDIIRVDRDNPKTSMAHARELLTANKIVLIFPEGTTRWKQSDELLPFKTGAVRLAHITHKPIIPFAINGKPKLFRQRSSIIFGKPLQLSGDIAIDNYQLRSSIARLYQQIPPHGRLNLLSGQPARNPSKSPPKIS